LLGNLTGLLATLKGLPSSYDKDLQEDKEPVFDTFDTLSLVLPVMAGAIRTLRLQPERMAAQLEPGLLATDLADYLAKKGMPFRQAHSIVGQVVRLAETKDVVLTDLTLADLQSVSDWFDEGATAVFNVQTVLANRAVTGGVAPSALETQLQMAQQTLQRSLL
jgi:argininosuccinate lyase